MKSSTASQFLCRADEIVEGDARGLASWEERDAKVILLRRCGRIFAYWDACPHYGDTPMAWRTNAYLNSKGNRVVCASHGAEFDVETGLCVSGAALGKYLKLAPIRMDESGDIYLESKED